MNAYKLLISHPVQEMTSSKKEVDERVCSDAKKFEELFYHAMDTRREVRFVCV